MNGELKPTYPLPSIPEMQEVWRMGQDDAYAELEYEGGYVLTYQWLKDHIAAFLEVFGGNTRVSLTPKGAPADTAQWVALKFFMQGYSEATIRMLVPNLRRVSS